MPSYPIAWVAEHDDQAEVPDGYSKRTFQYTTKRTGEVTKEQAYRHAQKAYGELRKAGLTDLVLTLTPALVYTSSEHKQVGHYIAPVRNGSDGAPVDIAFLNKKTQGFNITVLKPDEFYVGDGVVHIGRYIGAVVANKSSPSTNPHHRRQDTGQEAGLVRGINAGVVSGREEHSNIKATLSSVHTGPLTSATESKGFRLDVHSPLPECVQLAFHHARVLSKLNENGTPCKIDSLVADVRAGSLLQRADPSDERNDMGRDDKGCNLEDEDDVYIIVDKFNPTRNYISSFSWAMYERIMSQNNAGRGSKVIEDADDVHFIMDCFRPFNDSLEFVTVEFVHSVMSKSKRSSAPCLTATSSVLTSGSNSELSYLLPIATGTVCTSSTNVGSLSFAPAPSSDLSTPPDSVVGKSCDEAELQRIRSLALATRGTRKRKSPDATSTSTTTSPTEIGPLARAALETDVHDLRQQKKPRICN